MNAPNNRTGWEILDRFCRALVMARARWPNQRICQILMNSSPEGLSTFGDPFYVPDLALVEALERYAARKDDGI